MQTVIHVAFAVGRQHKGSAMKTVDLPFLVPPGAQLAMSMWKSQRLAKSVTINVDIADAPSVDVHTGVEEYPDEAYLAQVAETYRGDGWEVSGV